MSDSLPFHGEVRTTASESVPWWEPAPEKRPNIILVVFDDTGWSDFGCFGSEIATPTIDALAAEGLRFNSFHVTPLCSPTRAALLSGQNHHSIGMRFLADTDTGFPNSRGSIREDVPLLPQILGGHGYASYLVGKWHLAPLHEVTPAGPYRNWPLSRGFDRFYGFLDGCTDQYEPELYEDNHAIEAPRHPSYHLSEDLADHAIAMVQDHVSFRPDAPFFLQFAPGATHAPFQAPAEYIEKYISVFTKGWDETRIDRLRRQIELGLLPAGTDLAERPAEVSAWAQLDDDAKTLYAHLQAAFAGFLEHADAQLGRLVESLTDLGVRDDTIIVVLSDNGASREGGPHGDVNTNAPYNGVFREPTEQLHAISRIGELTTGAHYPEGWAMAGNTPFRYYKQFVDLGGVRSPLILSWPGGSTRQGDVVGSFVHAIDIAPTLLELVGIESHQGMHGESSVPDFETADPNGGRRTQYWETLGHRAIWHDGWKAVSAHVPGAPYSEDRWRLYNTTQDFSEVHDLAEAEPLRLRELQQLWWDEACGYDVFPLDDRPLQHLIAARGPVGLFAQERMVLRPGQSHIPFASAVTGSNRHMRIIVHLAHTNVTDGTLLSSGNAQGGYIFYLLDGRVYFEHQLIDERIEMSGEFRGACLIELELKPNGLGGAEARISADGVLVASGEIPLVGSHLSFWGMDVGHIGGSTFSERIDGPFRVADRDVERIELVILPSLIDLDKYAEVVVARE